MDTNQLVVELAQYVNANIGSVAHIEARDRDGSYELCVKPSNPGPCPFTVHAGNYEEITVEFGTMSIFDIPANSDDAAIQIYSVIQNISAGRVAETLWMRGGAPCKAMARIGEGDEAIVVHTRAGLCLRARRQPEHSYSPYL